jgi:carotenoid biosynthesis protein
LSPLPAGLYELCVAPLAFSLAFLHARRALGSRRAAGELVALAAYGYALEGAAIAAFAAHEYPPAWRVAPGGVPLAVVVVWAAVISSAMAVAVRRGAGSPPSRAVSAALLALLVDLAMEPVAVRAGLWRWTPPGAWLGVPVGNFVGWAVIVGSYTLGAERWAGSDRIWLQAGRRVALAVVSVLALLAVGAAWRGLAAETRFTPARAWTLWGAMILGTVFTARGTGRRGDPRTLAGRLGAAGPVLPGVVLLLVAAPFVVQAILFGDPALILAAAVPVGVLLFALR